jgi:hypothetical protein
MMRIFRGFLTQRRRGAERRKRDFLLVGFHRLLLLDREFIPWILLRIRVSIV